MKPISLYIKDFSGAGISDGNGINFTVFRTYGGDLRVRNNETGAVFDAIPVPPHGRLGDLDKLEEHFTNAMLYHSDGSKSGPFIAAGISQCLDILNGSLTPTIIPADKGG